MKRGLVLALALAVTAAVVSGCGKAALGQGSGEEVRLMVWSSSEDQSKDSGQWLQKSCERFAELHPEWNITSPRTRRPARMCSSMPMIR